MFNFELISCEWEYRATCRLQISILNTLWILLGITVHLIVQLICVLQFVDHDIQHTPSTTLTGFGKSANIQCCEVPWGVPGHPACFPIEIPHNDPFYSKFSLKCMNFVRSEVAPRPGCALGMYPARCLFRGPSQTTFNCIKIKSIHKYSTMFPWWFLKKLFEVFDFFSTFWEFLYFYRTIFLSFFAFFSLISFERLFYIRSQGAGEPADELYWRKPNLRIIVRRYEANADLPIRADADGFCGLLP